MFVPAWVAKNALTAGNKCSNGFVLPGLLELHSFRRMEVLVILAFSLIFIEPRGAVGGTVWEIK